MRAVIKFFFLQGKASKEIQAILTEILACFLPGSVKDLSDPLYLYVYFFINYITTLSKCGKEQQMSSCRY